MKLKTLKIYIIGLGSILLLFVAYKNLFSCGGGVEYDCEDYHYSFFNPEIINQPIVTPFFVTCHIYYGYSYGKTQELLNNEEWKIFLKNKLTIENINDLIYMKKENFISLYNYIITGIQAPSDLNVNKLSLKLKKIDNIKNILNYLKFSKDIEIFLPENNWDYDKVEISQIHSYIDTGIVAMKNTDVIFLKQRYAFQIEKLYFYIDNKLCENWYINNVVPLNPKGSIKYRSLGYYAGALYYQKRYTESNYIYSLIYDKYPQGKISAFESFHPWEDSDWDSTLNMAKNNREKAVLWQMFGVYADPMRGMKEIYKLNPKSELIDLLLTRSINIAEMKLLSNFSANNYNEYDEGYTYYTGNYSSSRSFSTFKGDSTYTELLTFIESCAKNNEMNNTCLWYNAAAYMNLLLHNNNKCEQYIEKVKTFSGISDENKIQMTVTEALLKIPQIEHIGKNTETVLYDYFSKLDSFKSGNNVTVFDYLVRKLSAIYENQGDSIKSELCYGGSNLDSYYNNNYYEGYRYSNHKYYFNEYSKNIDAKRVDSMLTFLRRKNLNKFEKLLVSHYCIKENEIVQYQAVNYMYDLQFEKAIKKFEEDTNTVIDNLYGNPFNIHIVDCHNCDHAAPQKTKYNKYIFAKKMLEIKTKADTSKDYTEKFQNYFLFANGLYNMTYYGNSRIVHSEIFLGRYSRYSADSRYNNTNHAKEYYQKAMQYATTEELKAKCAWMCAKCELTEFYESGNRQRGIDFKSGKYFKLLKDKYSETEYYNEIINQCGYFCTYNGRGEECIRHER